MSPQNHAPQILPIADVADEWVVRCDCGCKLFEQYANRDEAEARAAAAQDDAPLDDDPTRREVGHTDMAGRGADPI